MTISDDELARLEALAQAATPVQRVEVYERHCGNSACQCQSMTSIDDDNGDWCRSEDVKVLEEAYVAARDAVPALVAEVRRLRASLAEAVGRVERMEALCAAAVAWRHGGDLDVRDAIDAYEASLPGSGMVTGRTTG